MAITGGALIIAGTGAYASDKQRSTANKAKDAAVENAKADQAQQKQIADNQAAAALKAQQDAQAFETQRAATLAANQKQLAADTALSDQNQTTSDLTPTVQLATTEGDQSNAAARKRRAQFRPEYATGITI